MTVKLVDDMENLKILYLLTGEVLISQIEEVASELGEPDCKLIKPFLVKRVELTNSTTLENWLSSYSNQDNFMIHSDKILTIANPKATLIEKYEEFIKE